MNCQLADDWKSSDVSGMEVAHPHPLSDAPLLSGFTDACFDAPGSSVSTGTTIFAVSFAGGVVMGADTRTSAGSYIVNRAARKITPIHHKIFVGRSGSAADTQALARYVKHYISQHALTIGEAPKVYSAASLFKLLCYANKNFLTAGLIVAGWDKTKGGQVYSIPLGGSLIEVPYAAGGSGSTYIAGLLDHEWRPNMSKEECQVFVRKVVAHAIARDGSSGGMIRLITITEDDVTEEAIKGDDLPFELS